MRSKNHITQNPPPPIAEKPHPRESTKDRPTRAAQLDLTQPTELIIGETNAKKPIRVTRGETRTPKLAYTNRRKDKRKIPTGTIPKHFLCKRSGMTDPNRQTRIHPSQKRQMQKTRRRTKQSKITYSSYRKGKWKDPDKGQHIKRTRGSKVLYHPKTHPSQLIGKANAKNPTRPQRSGLGWLTQGLVFIE